ncbi:energy transducer TonB [Pseudohoeflea suaedae]|uniref:Energy transducer TonB n=1 Tax=Pseudohoeflea suaedae TaxID=877384 RepID=A0A4R5PQ66_9HYPH|nr:energy transducer TonB [Pseudohoeflea suaedae]TDH39088.1 energy transducer TonB [Pseudohoeflea suaedae]
MKLKTSHVAAAILLSAGIHLAVAGYFAPEEPEMKVAGGAAVDMLILGDAFEDAVQAGEPADDVTPVEETEASEAEPVETAELAPVEPVTEPQPEEVIESVEAVEPVELAPAEPVEAAPIAPSSELSALPDMPVPTPAPERPKVTRKTETKKPEPVRKAQSKPAPQKAAGAGGKQAANATRAASGEKTAEARRDPGNAQVSNYPGKVASRLRRALRYPTEARRDRLRGTTIVSFTVSANGSVSGVRVARSSGHAVLDEAARDAVHRAARFPAIPAAAGRSSWTFSVPLAFTR